MLSAFLVLVIGIVAAVDPGRAGHFDRAPALTQNWGALCAHYPRTSPW